MNANSEFSTDLITISRSTLKQALEALEAMTERFGFARLGSSSLADTMTRGDAHVAMNNLRAALAQQAEPVQEPVAWNWMLDGQPYEHPYYGKPPDADIVESLRLREDRTVRLLYAGPPQRKHAEPVQEPVARSLTEDERAAIEYFALNPSMAVLAFSHWLRRDKSAPLQRLAEPVEPVAQFNLNTMPGQADAHLRALLRYTENFYATAIEHGMRAGPTANAIAHVERAGKALHQIVHAQAKMLEPAQPVEPVDPVAVVATQSDVWHGYNGQWAPPGEPIKMAMLLRDLPIGTLLYTAPPQQAVDGGVD